jgi:hypothetical protein
MRDTWLAEVSLRIDGFTMEQLLLLHEQLFGPVAPATRRRMLAAAVGRPEAGAAHAESLPIAA